MFKKIISIFLILYCGGCGNFRYLPDGNSTYKIRTGHISFWRNRSCVNWEDDVNKRKWIICGEGELESGLPGGGVFFRWYIDQKGKEK